VQNTRLRRVARSAVTCCRTSSTGGIRTECGEAGESEGLARQLSD
jgi:hypothetical protein